ncbi:MULTISPECIES: hypothetical protein [unclassified Streptomyces]|uniref:hypothetical protein n=1 Tax=unclassified Streptomyces TaxID=2593676 RepID=UPI0035D5D1B3
MPSALMLVVFSCRLSAEALAAETVMWPAQYFHELDVNVVRKLQGGPDAQAGRVGHTPAAPPGSIAIMALTCGFRTSLQREQ